MEYSGHVFYNKYLVFEKTFLLQYIFIIGPESRLKAGDKVFVGDIFNTGPRQVVNLLIY